MEINAAINSAYADMCSDIYSEAHSGAKSGVQSGWRRGAILAAMMMLSACSSAANLELPNEQSAQDQTASILAQLPPQKLEAGQCGLFVWSADSERRFILFSSTETQRALWHDGEAVLELSFEQSAGEQAGERAYDQFPAQDYGVIGSPQRLSLRLSDSEQVETATRFKSGRLTQSGPSDWDRVIPVLGLASCQP